MFFSHIDVSPSLFPPSSLSKTNEKNISLGYDLKKRRRKVPLSLYLPELKTQDSFSVSSSLPLINWSSCLMILSLALHTDHSAVISLKAGVKPLYSQCLGHNSLSIIFIYLFLERGEGKEKERERKINVWLPLVCPLLGTQPATQACVLTGNRTGDPLVHSPHSIH